jgi:hypothetical protein
MPSKQSEAVKRRWEVARMAMERPDVEPLDLPVRVAIGGRMKVGGGVRPI